MARATLFHAIFLALFLAAVRPTRAQSTFTTSDADDVADAILSDPFGSIYEYVTSSADHTVLTSLLQVVKLDSLLNNPQASITLFAPTDTAFAEFAARLDPDATLPDATDSAAVITAIQAGLERIGGKSLRSPRKILRYHSISTAYSFGALIDMESIASAAGPTLEFSDEGVQDKDVGATNVATPNVLNTNGWIHSVDSVLVPFNLTRVLDNLNPTTIATTPPTTTTVTVAQSVPLTSAAADGVDGAIVLDPLSTLLQFVATSAEHTVLAALAPESGVTDVLDDPTTRFTLLAPTDTAFASLAQRLSPDGTEFEPTDIAGIVGAITTALDKFQNIKLRTPKFILLYHAIPAAYPYEELVSMGTVSTMAEVSLVFKDSTIIDKDREVPAEVETPNILNQNGWIHSIDSILLPFNLSKVLRSDGEGTTTTPAGPLTSDAADGVEGAVVPDPLESIYRFVATSANHTVLAKLLAAVGLETALDDDSARLTLLAPTNDAFSNLAGRMNLDTDLDGADVQTIVDTIVAGLATIAGSNIRNAESILKYHAVKAAYTYEQLIDVESADTLASRTVTFSADGIEDADDEELASVVARDVLNTNGWIHSIDSVLLPFDLSAALDSASEGASPGPEEPSTNTGSNPIGGEGSGNSDSEIDDDANPSESPEDDGVCFPASARVAMVDGSQREMHTLEAGHMVRHDENEGGSAVFLFTHRDAKRRARFVRLATSCKNAVTLTHNHYLYANGKLVAASAVRVGDALRGVNGGACVVSDISTVHRVGLFAPHSMHGDLVVDGIVVSGYSRAVSPRVAHAMLLPVRWMSRVSGMVEPLGSSFYQGADWALRLLPKGQDSY